MTLLDEWLGLPASERSASLGQPRVQNAITALGTEAGVAWLEGHIESPVVRAWGESLFRLRPPWHHLERWMRLSNVHCLAATDALLCYSGEPEMPSGASVGTIHAAMDAALAAYGNRRLKDTAEEISHVWPIGSRKRHPVDVPSPLAEAAEILFRGDSSLMRAWHESMATCEQPADGPDDVWEALLRFGEARKLIAIVDWRESPKDVAGSLQSLQPARTMKLAWERLAFSAGELEMALNVIGAAAVDQGQALVSLDHGADNYCLAFMPSDALHKFKSLINSLANNGIGVRIFG